MLIWDWTPAISAIAIRKRAKLANGCRCAGVTFAAAVGESPIRTDGDSRDGDQWLSAGFSCHSRFLPVIPAKAGIQLPFVITTAIQTNRATQGSSLQ